MDCPSVQECCLGTKPWTAARSSDTRPWFAGRECRRRWDERKAGPADRRPVAQARRLRAPRLTTTRARRSGCARALWLSRNALDHLSGVLVFSLQGDIGLRNHADEAIVLGGHG